MSGGPYKNELSRDAARGYGLGSAGRKPPRELLGALDARDALIDDLRETAWEHRDIDPHLSTIFIDKIRAATYRKELP